MTTPSNCKSILHYSGYFLLTFALESGWRVDHVPHGFTARLAGGGRAEVDGYEVVPLKLDDP